MIPGRFSLVIQIQHNVLLLLLETFSSSATTEFFLVGHATKLLRLRNYVLFIELLPALYIVHRKYSASICGTNE